MRPLARWTFGKPTPPGEETLRASVRRFRLLYPEFDMVVCHNHLTPDQRDRLGRLGVPLHEQRAGDLDYPLVSADAPPGRKWAMPGWGWKLVPPRLRPAAHELFIDNDVVLRDRLPAVDRWLATGRTLLSTGLSRAFGAFDPDIPAGETHCAGFFGLPPGFDFGAALLGHLHRRLGGRPLGYYDEQGATTAAVLEGDPVVVPADELVMVKRVRRPFPRGFHFVGVNRSQDHAFWNRYKCSVLLT